MAQFVKKDDDLDGEGINSYIYITYIYIHLQYIYLFCYDLFNSLCVSAHIGDLFAVVYEIVCVYRSELFNLMIRWFSY